jgi:hypothetical protein
MTGSAAARINVPEAARPKQIGHWPSAGAAGFPTGERPSSGPMLGFAELGPTACPQFAPTRWTCPIESPSCSARASSASHAPRRRSMAVMLSTIALDLFCRQRLGFKIDYRGAKRVAPSKSHRRYEAGPTQTRRGGREILTLQGASGHGRPMSHGRRTAASGRPAGSITVPRTTRIGATSSLPFAPARVP